MSALDDLRQAATEAIEAAFPVAPVPDAAEVRKDHCPECREISERFVGKPWPEITVADLGPNLPVSLLTTPAFRYYLPALMLLSMEVRARLDLLPSALVGTLSPPGGKVSRGMEGRLTGYPRDQVLAILAFLRHEEAADADEATDSSRRVMARAIKYWNGLAG